MGYIFNSDFRDFIACFNINNVRYILVGFILLFFMDIQEQQEIWIYWVERTAENHLKIKKAFEEFGMPVFDMTEENFLHHPVWDVFTYGIPPVAIDLMIGMEGFNFQEIYERSIFFKDDDIEIRVIHKNDLVCSEEKSRAIQGSG